MSSKLQALNDVLCYIVPSLSALFIPLTLFNFYVFLRQGAFHRASHFIYLNLVLMDTLNALEGILLVIFWEV